MSLASARGAVSQRTEETTDCRYMQAEQNADSSAQRGDSYSALKDVSSVLPASVDMY